MMMADPPGAPPPRLAVLNLDRLWDFPALVRRHALDVFADPDRAVDIRFRTLTGTRADANAAGRLKAWGAARPLFYGGDWEGLIADVMEDLEDVASNRISLLLLVVVVREPAPAQEEDDEADGEAAIERLLDALRRIETRLDADGELRTRTRRTVCLLPHGPGGEAALPALLTALLTDAGSEGRELADTVLRLMPADLLPHDLDTERRQFVLLRAAMALVLARARGAGAAGEGASTAGKLLEHRALTLSLAGKPAPSASGAIAGLIAFHIERAAMRPPTPREMAEPGLDAPTRYIRDILAVLDGEMAPRAAVPDAAAPSDTQPELDPLPQAGELLRASRWWTARGERELVSRLDAVPGTLRAMVDRGLTGFPKFRAELESRIAEGFDADMRRRIGALALIGGGVSGAAAYHIAGLRRQVTEARARAVQRADLARRSFMGALLPERPAPADEARDPVQEAAFGGIDLDRLADYVALRAEIGELRGHYRGLIPQAYAWMLGALIALALLTVAAHTWGRTLSASEAPTLPDFAVSLFTKSGALLAAVVASAGIGALALHWFARMRHRQLTQALDRAEERHGQLVGRVQEMIASAFNYVRVSRHLVFYDLVLAELDARTEEDGNDALKLALEDIGGIEANPSAGARAGADAFSTEMESALAVLPAARWMRRMLEPPNAFGAAGLTPRPLVFVLAEAGSSRRRRRPPAGQGSYELQATLFLAPQTVDAAPLAVADAKDTP